MIQNTKEVKNLKKLVTIDTLRRCLMSNKVPKGNGSGVDGSITITNVVGRDRKIVDFASCVCS